VVYGCRGPRGSIPDRGSYSGVMVEDPFTILGLPRRFEVEPGAVERAYLARVAALHPDLAVGDSEAGGRAARLNDARAIVSDPERRGEALLALMGGSAQAKALPPGLLMEVMEARESAESALALGDAAGVARWRAWAEARRVEHMERVGALFEEAGRGGSGALDLIRMELNAWRYVERMLEQLGPGRGPRST